MSNMFASACAPGFIDHMGEAVEYRPAGSAARPIRAVVERSTPMGIPELGRSVAPSTIVTVLDDAVRGISRAELNAGADMIAVAVKAGGSLVERAIGTIDTQEGGMLRLHIR